MKKIIMTGLCVCATAFASGAAKWQNLDEKSHISGAKLDETDLLGKVVLVYYWDCAMSESLKLLPEVEKVWSAFKTKKFQVVGAYIGARNEEKIKEEIAKAKVSFPVYYKFSLDPDPKPNFTGAPYFSVVNHRGTGIYNGKGPKEGQEKIVDAISSIGMPINLAGDTTLKKFKGLAGQLKFGKNVTGVVKKLEKEMKSKDQTASVEASELLSAIDSARSAVKEDIELYKEADPAEAVKLIGLFLKTWPKDSEAAAYKEAIASLKKAAAERAKTEKEKAKAKEKAQ